MVEDPQVENPWGLGGPTANYNDTHTGIVRRPSLISLNALPGAELLGEGEKVESVVYFVGSRGNAVLVVPTRFPAAGEGSQGARGVNRESSRKVTRRNNSEGDPGPDLPW